MPFTLAHPAAVLPLHRRIPALSSLSALVLGCMAPDLAYAVPGVGREATHGLAGLLWFCLPATLLMYVAFHASVRPMACWLLPRAVRDRLPVWAFASGLPAVAPVAVAASALVGAATHVAWDSFTHDTGSVVRAWPLLQRPIATWSGYTLTVYRVLQHGSSAVGMIVVAVWLWSRWRRAPVRRERPGWEPSPRLRHATVAALLAVPAVCGIAAGLAAISDGPTLASLRAFTARAIFTAGAVMLASTLVAGLLWRWRSVAALAMVLVALTAGHGRAQGGVAVGTTRSSPAGPALPFWKDLELMFRSGFEPASRMVLPSSRWRRARGAVGRLRPLGRSSEALTAATPLTRVRG